MSEERGTRLRAAWDVLLLLLAAVSIGIIAYVELEGLRPGSATFTTLANVDLVIVAFFATDLVLSFSRSDDRRRWLRAHW